MQTCKDLRAVPDLRRPERRAKVKSEAKTLISLLL